VTSTQAEYWNRVGPTKTFAHPVNVALLRTYLEPDSALLDYGCGYGRSAGILSTNGFQRVVGVDPAAEMIAIARRDYPQLHFEVMTNPPRVGAPDASFDGALLVAVLTCVPADNDQRAIVAEIARVLRSGGVLYVGDLWLQNDERNIARYERGSDVCGTYGVFDLREGVTMRHHDRRWFADLMSGFDTLHLADLEVHTMNGHTAIGFQWIGRKKGAPVTRPEVDGSARAGG